MLGNLFTQTIHVPGTLAANIAVKFILPVDVKLIHVSACGSNANSGILDIGPSTDTDGYLDGVSIGDSDVPSSSTVMIWLERSSPTSPKARSFVFPSTTTAQAAPPPPTSPPS